MRCRSPLCFNTTCKSTRHRAASQQQTAVSLHCTCNLDHSRKKNAHSPQLSSHKQVSLPAPGCQKNHSYQPLWGACQPHPVPHICPVCIACSTSGHVCPQPSTMSVLMLLLNSCTQAAVCTQHAHCQQPSATHCCAAQPHHTTTATAAQPWLSGPPCAWPSQRLQLRPRPPARCSARLAGPQASPGKQRLQGTALRPASIP